MPVASGKRLRSKTNNDMKTKLIILFCHSGGVRDKTSIEIMKNKIKWAFLALSDSFLLA